MMVGVLTDGTLVFGLSAENVRRLQLGQPIRVTTESHGVELPDGCPRVVIMYGTTEADCMQQLQDAIRRGP